MPYRNDVFKFSKDGQRTRFLSGDPTRNDAWVINLDNQSSFPKWSSLSDLQAKEASGELIIIETGPTSPVARQVSEAARARRDEAWGRIEPLVNNPDIFIPGKRSRLLKGRAKEIGCTLFTLYKDLRRYWHGGQSKDALIPAFHSCGRHAKLLTVGRGRIPDGNRYPIYQLQAEDIQRIKAAIKKHYLIGEVPTIDYALQKMLETKYTYQDGNGNSYLMPLGERPSLRQFSNILRTQFSVELKIRSREGDKLFEQNSRALLGSAQDDCLGVGHIYEIDATIADIFLVSTGHRNLIIGKPSLYLIYDRRSRLVVGWYLGLEAPSWPAAMQAILSIAEDKALLCQRYGVDYDPTDWPAHGVFPQTFLGDLGEMVSKNSSLIVEGLEVSVANTPPMRPELKGTVECGIKLVQRSMAATTPGYEPPNNVTKRRGKKYDLDACLTVHEINALILKNIITHNRKIMKGYPVSVEFLAQGVLPIPKNIWAYEAQKRMGMLTRYGEAHVRFSLLPHAEATVTRNGILFNGCYYSCPEAIEEGWFVRAGKGVAKKKLSYDLRLVDSIYLHDMRDPTKYVVATLLEKSRQYKGLSFAEVQAYEKLGANVRRDAEQHNRQGMADYHTFSEPITTAAQAATKKVSKGISRSARKADIHDDRLDERRAQRQQEARMPTDVKPEPVPTNNVIALSPKSESRPPPSATASPDAPMTLDEKLRRKRQEMLNAHKP